MALLEKGVVGCKYVVEGGVVRRWRDKSRHASKKQLPPSHNAAREGLLPYPAKTHSRRTLAYTSNTRRCVGGDDNII